MEPMKQQCYLYNVWFTWLGIPGLAIFAGIAVGWWASPGVLLAGIFAQVAYVRIFPRISKYLGYGSVEDEAVDLPGKSQAILKVTLYTANVCPFCPIVRRRLLELQRPLKFDFSEVDVTFHTNLIRQKGIRSVPVVETDGRLWVGNATTAQLLSFLTNAK